MATAVHEVVLEIVTRRRVVVESFGGTGDVDDARTVGVGRVALIVEEAEFRPDAGGTDLPISISAAAMARTASVTRRRGDMAGALQGDESAGVLRRIGAAGRVLDGDCEWLVAGGRGSSWAWGTSDNILFA